MGRRRPLGIPFSAFCNYTRHAEMAVRANGHRGGLVWIGLVDDAYDTSQ